MSQLASKCARGSTVVCQHLVVIIRSSFAHKVNKIKDATRRQNNPIASDKANPRIANENNCCFIEGYLA